jgi:outer membrane protein
MKNRQQTHSAPLAMAVLLPLLGTLSNAHAEDSPWSIRVGPAMVAFDASAKVDVGGANVPGANVAVKDNTALAFDIGYALDDRWTIRTAFGVPPTTTLSAAGSLKGFVPPLTGTLGKVKYGPAVLSATWKLGKFGVFEPYLGAGLNYTHVFSSKDGDLAGLKVKSAFGTALQVGFDVSIDRHWGLFLDARKIYVKTTATGTVPALGGPPAKASVILDPLIVHMGASYRF